MLDFQLLESAPKTYIFWLSLRLQRFRSKKLDRNILLADREHIFYINHLTQFLTQICLTQFY